jgi:cell wall-associated NlpC family hydrolase
LRGLPLLTCMLCALAALIGAPAAGAQSQSGTGGTSFDNGKKRTKPRAAQIVPGPTATIGSDGLATAPAEAPPEVHAAITAANRIIGKPYRYGGGHAKVEDSGYDCSGTVSYALIGAKLLDAPLDSSSFMRWGDAGPGKWITVYTNPGHAFVVIAGLRLDTSAANDPSGRKGPRWRPALRSTRGFRARHPDGF